MLLDDRVLVELKTVQELVHIFSQRYRDHDGNE